MKRGLTSQRLCRCCAVLVLVAGAAHPAGSRAESASASGGRTGAAWRVVPFEAAEDGGLPPPLPPLAAVTGNDASGETWQQSGRMSGTLEVVRGDFRQAFRRDGWSLDKTIPLGRAPNRSELSLWARAGRRIMLMLWEKDVGTCGFAWGEAR